MKINKTEIVEKKHNHLMYDEIVPLPHGEVYVNKLGTVITSRETFEEIIKDSVNEILARLKNEIKKDETN